MEDAFKTLLFEHGPVKEVRDPTSREARRCYFLAISSLAILPEFEEINNSLNLCRPHDNGQDKEAYGKCTSYVAATLIYHSIDFKDQALNYCSRVASNAQEKCFAIVESMINGNSNNPDIFKIF